VIGLTTLTNSHTINVGDDVITSPHKMCYQIQMNQVLVFLGTIIWTFIENFMFVAHLQCSYGHNRGETGHACCTDLRRSPKWGIL
jgi:hypothetical protein